MLWRLLVVPVLALALAGVAACGDDDGDSDDGPTETALPAQLGGGYERNSKALAGAGIRKSRFMVRIGRLRSCSQGGWWCLSFNLLVAGGFPA